MDGNDQDLPSDAIEALGRGSKIEAIKHVRTARRVDLKDSKELVERFIDSHPDVKERMQAANRESAKGLAWLFWLAALGAGVYYFLLR